MLWILIIERFGVGSRLNGGYLYSFKINFLRHQFQFKSTWDAIFIPQEAVNRNLGYMNCKLKLSTSACRADVAMEVRGIVLKSSFSRSAPCGKLSPPTVLYPSLSKRSDRPSPSVFWLLLQAGAKYSCIIFLFLRGIIFAWMQSREGLHAQQKPHQDTD